MFADWPRIFRTFVVVRLVVVAVGVSMFRCRFGLRPRSVSIKRCISILELAFADGVSVASLPNLCIRDAFGPPSLGRKNPKLPGGNFVD